MPHQTPDTAGICDLARPEGAAALRRGWARLGEAAVLPTQDASYAIALTQTMLAGTAVVLWQAGFGADGAGALLPLCRTQGMLQRWNIPGAREVAEPFDALCRDSAAALSLARALAVQRRPIDLARIPADSPLIPALQQAMRRHGLIRVRPAAPCPYIALDPAWAEPASRFKSSRQSDFRRAARRAAEFGKLSYEMLSPTPSQFDALFDEAIAIERMGWKEAAGTAIALDPAKTAFFRSYLSAAAERGMLRIAFLRIDGQAVAMQLAVEWAGRYWLYKIGYNEAYARCSPGTLLMLFALGEAARGGLTSFELMGDVEPWIADFWTSASRPCVRVRTYPANWRGAAAFVQDGIGWLTARAGGKGAAG
ncbi:GNAT family N-acetyltransferase [Novosphingobium sp.]|uniref:GNAT family N-acetyltransferase n=1 Tax=Novosphingobium sp. TaxID=1874826 RepID=UPI0035B4B84C